jgi:uncharacterized protein (DUF1778 family)
MTMPNDSSPVSFRLSNEERKLLDAVAHYMGETLSHFIRRSALSVAQGIVDKNSPEVVLVGYKKMLARRAEWDTDQVAGFEQQLRRSE